MSDGLNVNVKPRLIVVPRLNVLTTAISEFAAAFGAKADCIESIKKVFLNDKFSKKFICAITINKNLLDVLL